MSAKEQGALVMGVFQANCPHCGTKAVAFTILSVHQPKTMDSAHWDSFATCGNCMRCVLAVFACGIDADPKWLLANGRHHLVTLMTVFPSLPNSGAPEHTPENAARYYEQGVDNLPNNFDASGTMFRSALEAGLKAKFPSLTGSLYQRIRQAASDNQLTPEMADWANKIRLDGNEAAHGVEVPSDDEESNVSEKHLTKERAIELHTFTELLFTYLFTLPGRLEEARGVPETGDDFAPPAE